jgi:hypothetical protein
MLTNLEFTLRSSLLILALMIIMQKLFLKDDQLTLLRGLNICVPYAHSGGFFFFFLYVTEVSNWIDSTRLCIIIILIRLSKSCPYRSILMHNIRLKRYTPFSGMFRALAVLKTYIDSIAETEAESLYI